MFELYNPVQEQLNILRDMRRYHQEMHDADIVASFNVQFADSLEIMESEPVPVQSERKISAKQRRAAHRTLEVRKGITVTMEWDVPEAVKGEPI